MNHTDPSSPRPDVTQTISAVYKNSDASGHTDQLHQIMLIHLSTGHTDPMSTSHLPPHAELFPDHGKRARDPPTITTTGDPSVHSITSVTLTVTTQHLVALPTTTRYAAVPPNGSTLVRGLP